MSTLHTNVTLTITFTKDRQKKKKLVDIETLPRVIISYEIYETGLQRISLVSYYQMTNNVRLTLLNGIFHLHKKKKMHC